MTYGPSYVNLSFASTFAEATLGNAAAGNTIVQTVPIGAFTKIMLNAETADPGNNFDPATNIYTVPASGTYLIIMKLRIQDTFAAGTNFGFSVHTTDSDNPAFQWHVTTTNRKVYDYQRMSFFTKGDFLRAVAFTEGNALPISVANFTIIRIA